MRRLPALLLPLAILVVPIATSLGQPLSPDAADARFREGNAAYHQKRFADARAAYEEAFRVKRTHDIAANLGFAEVKLELWRDAATHLAFALRNWAPTGKVESRESAAHWLEIAKQRVGTLVVTAPPGAKVSIDGELIGTAPLDELFVDPGAHTVACRLEGYDAAEQTVQIEKGKASPVTLAPAKSASPAPGPSASATSLPAPTASGSAPPPPPPPRPPLALVIASGALGAAGLAAGAGLTVAANGKAADVTRMQLGRSACAAPAPSAADACSALHDAASSKTTLSNAAVSTFLAGSAFALVAAGLGVWVAVTPKEAPIHVVPTGGRDGAGLIVHGSW